jgi:hypothetical protein
MLQIACHNKISKTGIRPKDNNRPYFIASQAFREAGFICSSKNSNGLQNRFFSFSIERKNPGALPGFSKTAVVCKVIDHGHLLAGRIGSAHPGHCWR